jgi:hypothetical protein
LTNSDIRAVRGESLAASPLQRAKTGEQERIDEPKEIPADMCEAGI